MDGALPQRRVLALVSVVVVVVLSLLYVLPYGTAGAAGPWLVPPLIVVLGWPLVALRRHPVSALSVVLLSTVALTPLLDVEVVGPVGVLAMDAAVGRLAATRSWRVSLPGAVVALLVQAALAATFYMTAADDAQRSIALLTLIMVCVWTIGNSVRQRSEFVRARRVEETERAVTAERLRIARDLHDLIAHSMGVIAIQAGVGRRVIDNRPDEARNALDAIETTSRETLAELRRTLTALRRTEPEGLPTAPSPGLADLDRLITTAADAGVRVEVERTGAIRDLPGDLDLSAYRIVQEAVTNVVRHASTDRCRVLLDYRDDALSIEVLDDGPGTGAPGTGYGLVGMRERVTLLNGRFTAGPRPEGGFCVAASIPVPS
ncbi:sensor histidine kinase [Cryptosporangium aurantiacum]|uniref:histidine kinase n=1 Tax=Cryptosporangium aurantiacum TaxID=134849 RepID=A0A1M7R868_9ACTN|nr:sensor histidine kinase [Cryptosporangium aurantiacum]SHN42535.1 Signal transduction histidine kinase [Cryptosporangium aurantiacum]